jgi:hypothetical protein
MTPHELVVLAVAQDSTARMVERCQLALSNMREGLQSGDDGLLTNLWEEFCAQVQGEHSIYWSEYEVLVRDIVARESATLTITEQRAIWLQTDAGVDWAETPDSGHQGIPVEFEQVTECIYSALLKCASDWHSPGLDRYLER